MTPDDRWLAAVWPFVRGQLPPSPARVLEVGCGSLGGFVPALLDDGYRAVGVDPEAPEGSDYQRVKLEHNDPPWPVECVVASTSLHHVADLDEVLDRLEALLVPGWCAGGGGVGLGAVRRGHSPVVLRPADAAGSRG